MSPPRKVHTVESLLARTVEEGDCLLWQGYVGNGVPQVYAPPGSKRKMIAVRRLLRELTAERVPADGNFSVTCGNPLCVNPDHTIWVNPKRHMKRMADAREYTDLHAAKARQAKVERGEVKLDQYKAQEIRLSEEPCQALADRFGVSKSLVQRIKAGKQWRVLVSPFAGLFPGKR